MAKRQRRSRSGKSIESIRAQGRYEAACEAERIAARLQVRLGPERWSEILAGWEQKPNTFGLPEEQRDYLIKVATDQGVSLAGI